MDKTRKLYAIAAAAALLAACAAPGPETAIWTPSPAGSSWKMAQKNTGSYGKDVELVMTRGDGVWQGQPVVAVEMSNGASLMITPDSKWTAIVSSKDGKPLMTFDPPIGYVFPMKVGQSWKTHHKATNIAAGGKVFEFDYSCNIEAFERVTVRAGSFDAYKIVCENEYSREIAWFSPEPGLNVKSDNMRKAANPSGAGTQQSELVALNLAK